MIYYGMDDPNFAAAEGYRGRVVLQSYHPLVATGRYAEVFPHAERYLYYNPVKTYGEGEILLFGQEQDELEARKLTESLQLMSIAGACGLFVDDCDHWLLEGKRLDQGQEFLAQIAHNAGGRLILNRGFSFWPSLQAQGALAAVVLENIGPCDIAALAEEGCRGDLQWLYEQLSRSLTALRMSDKAPPQVFSLSYRSEPLRPSCELAERDPEVHTLYLALSALLGRFMAGKLQSNIQLDCWPDPFQAVG